MGDVLDNRAFWPRLMQYQRLEEARHTSARTLQTRLECITDFIRWCVERGLRQPAEVTRPVLEQYQRCLFLYRKRNGDPLSVRSQRSRLGSVQGWFRWQMHQGLLLSNPAADLLLPKEPYKLPKDVLSAEEAERVMAVADVNTPAGLRDRALLELLYSTGMRRMEICGLDIWSVSQQRGAVTIRQGKGNKERIEPVGARALGWVARYLAQGRESARQLPPVPAHDGNPDAGERCGHALDTGHARSQQAGNHADLHAGQHPGAEGDPRRHASGRASSGRARRNTGRYGVKVMIRYILQQYLNDSQEITMPKEAVFTMKLENSLREEFIAAAKASDRPASQVIRELMRDYIRRQDESRAYDTYLAQKVEKGRQDIRAGNVVSNEEVEAQFAARRAKLAGKA